MRARKEQKIAKAKASVPATGGLGFRYENQVAARFLLDLLSGTNALGKTASTIRTQSRR